MKYEFLDHTADAKIRSYGQNIKEAFVNAGLAVFSLLKNPGEVKSIINKDINVESKEYSSLLYDFIEELLFLLDTEGFLLSKITNLKIEKKQGKLNLNCKIQGDNYKKYGVSGNVKSITYNDMIINQDFAEKDKKVMLQFVVDL